MAQTTGEQQVISKTEEAVGLADSPPLVYSGALVAGLLLNRALRLPFLPRGIARPAGVVLAIGGLALGGAAVREMRRAGTSPRPDVPTRAVVETGPYRYTRNPIYVGMSLLYAGISTFADALWPLLFLPAALAAISQSMVEREERYLERRFGEPYRQYKARVRRWI